MKTQMRFQKILMIITVIIGALGVVFALVFSSGSFAQVQRLSKISEIDLDSILAGAGASTDITKEVFLSTIVDVKDCVNLLQTTNDNLLTLSIVFVVVCILPIIAACQKRRKYYITNYIAIGITLAMQLIFIIIVAIYVSSCLNAFTNLNFDACKYLYDYYKNASSFGEYSANPWTVTFGFVLIGLVAANMVVLVLNLVWKILLMRGEKKLLEQGEKASAESVDVAAEVV